MTSPAEQQNAAGSYDFEAALTEEERKVLLGTGGTGAFLRDEGQPPVAAQWADGTFPEEPVARFRESGPAGLPSRCDR
ncbi:hypothetical protein ABT269_39085 [Streptomyces viridosporus]|uniref:hypothetical protein n=2 Tax=Streptomyces viridosporus TaxID=67581 RepID=UPI0033192335